MVYAHYKRYNVGERNDRRENSSLFVIMRPKGNFLPTQVFLPSRPIFCIPSFSVTSRSSWENRTIDVIVWCRWAISGSGLLLPLEKDFMQLVSLEPLIDVHCIKWLFLSFSNMFFFALRIIGGSRKFIQCSWKISFYWSWKKTLFMTFLRCEENSGNNRSLWMLSKIKEQFRVKSSFLYKIKISFYSKVFCNVV